MDVLASDLAAERFQLPPDQYQDLVTATGVVVHAAGLVSFLSDYQAHRAANVAGTQELLRLAAAGGGTPIHALSTLSVVTGAGAGGSRSREDELPSLDGLPGDGYSRSKYVAERLLENGRHEGIGSVVYRLGEVWPHRRLGVANPASLAHTVLYACVRVGGRFETAAMVRGVPVDVVAGLVAEAATGERPLPEGALHVLWPGAFRLVDVFAELARNRPLELLGYAEFRNRVEVLARRPDPDERLVRLRLLLPPPDPGRAPAPAAFEQLFAAASTAVETTRFARYAGPAATGPDSVCRPIEAGLAGYLRELARTPTG